MNDAIQTSVTDPSRRRLTVARLVLVHAALNELWGPHELKARWLPARRDGLWHQRVQIDEADVEVCFYGDLFRRAPGSEEEHRLEQTRPGIADALSARRRPGTRPLGARRRLGRARSGTDSALLG
jgi:hypothetical protein